MTENWQLNGKKLASGHFMSRVEGSDAEVCRSDASSTNYDLFLYFIFIDRSSFEDRN